MNQEIVQVHVYVSQKKIDLKCGCSTDEWGDSETNELLKRIREWLEVSMRKKNFPEVRISRLYLFE